MDPLRNVSPGESPARLLKASTFNLQMDAARWVRQHGRGAQARRGAVGADGVEQLPARLEVRVRASGTLPQFAVVRITGTLIDPDEASMNALNTPVFSVGAPVSADDFVVILTEPLAAGKIGRAVVAGVAVASVEVTDSSHQFAVPVAGDVFGLVSAESGGIRLLAPSGDGTGGGGYRQVLLAPPSAPPPAGGCSGCGWVAGLTELDCLLATVVERLGRCACGAACVDTDTGAKYAGTITGMGDMPDTWAFTERLGELNDEYAGCDLPAGAYSETLSLSNFGFGVPDGATIKGIKIEVLGKYESEGVRHVVDALVAVHYPGGFVNLGPDTTQWPDELPYLDTTYGGPTSLLGRDPGEWTPAQVNSLDVRFRAYNDPEFTESAAAARIDAFRVTVYYCTTGEAPATNDEVYLVSEDGETWEAAEGSDPATITICGVEYALTFSKEGCDGPCLTLTSGGGSGTAYTTTRDCCGPNYAIFAVGNPAVCTGTTDATAGPVGNVTRIKVQWSCCPAEGYAGPGYYCVRDAGTSGPCAAVEITSAADACADEIEICDGPFSTLEEAQAACPAPTPATVECCVSEVPATLNLTMEFGGTGNPANPDCPPDLDGTCVLSHIVDIPASYTDGVTPRPSWVGGYETTYVGVSQPTPPYLNYQLYCDDWSSPGFPRWHIRMVSNNRVMSAADWAEFMETGSYCDGFDLTGTCGPLSLTASSNFAGGLGLGCTSCANGVHTTYTATVTE